MALPCTTCPWYAWKRPDVNLARVHCFGVYVKGTDSRGSLPIGASPGTFFETVVVENMRSMLKSCEQFHQEQLPGSVLTWSIHGPVELPIALDSLNGEIGANAYFNLGSSIVRLLSEGTLSSSSSVFPSLICHSDYPEAIPGSDHPSSSSTLASDGLRIKGELPNLPTHCVFALFSDYGQEPTDSLSAPTTNTGTVITTDPRPPLDLLRKYFIWKAAEPVAKAQGQTCEEFLSTVYRTGGSRASFVGTVAVSTLYAAFVSAQIIPSLSLSSSSSSPKSVYRIQTLLPNQCTNDPTGNTDDNNGPLMIGLGIGIVTREAWLHGKTIPSCSAVCYHEAIGHGSNMPHPSTRSPLCVMDAGMYTGQSLHSSTVCICDEIKMNMKDEESNDTNWKKNINKDESSPIMTNAMNRTPNLRKTPSLPPGNYTFMESIPLPSRQYPTASTSVAAVPTPAPLATDSESSMGISSNHSLATTIISRTLSRFQTKDNDISSSSASLPLYVSWMYTDEDTSDNTNTSSNTVTCLRRTDPVQIAHDAMCALCKTNIVETVYRLYMKYDPNHTQTSPSTNHGSTSIRNTSSSVSPGSNDNQFIPAEWIEPALKDCNDATTIPQRIAQLCSDTLLHVQGEIRKQEAKEKESTKENRTVNVDGSVTTGTTTTLSSFESILTQGKSILLGQQKYPWEETSSCITSLIETIPEMKRIRATDVYHFKEIILSSVHLPIIDSDSISSSTLFSSAKIKYMDTVHRLFNRICPSCLSTKTNASILYASPSWPSIADELGLLNIKTVSPSLAHHYYVPILDDGRNIAILLPLFDNVALISGTGSGIPLLSDSSSVTLPSLSSDNLDTVFRTITKDRLTKEDGASGKIMDTVQFYGFHTGQWVYGLPS